MVAEGQFFEELPRPCGREVAVDFESRVDGFVSQHFLNHFHISSIIEKHRGKRVASNNVRRPEDVCPPFYMPISIHHESYSSLFHLREEIEVHFSVPFVAAICKLSPTSAQLGALLSSLC